MFDRSYAGIQPKISAKTIVDIITLQIQSRILVHLDTMIFCQFCSSIVPSCLAIYEPLLHACYDGFREIYTTIRT